MYAYRAIELKKKNMKKLKPTEEISLYLYIKSQETKTKHQGCST